MSVISEYLLQILPVDLSFLEAFVFRFYSFHIFTVLQWMEGG